jgi:hypothetical protein
MLSQYILPDGSIVLEEDENAMFQKLTMDNDPFVVYIKIGDKFLSKATLCRGSNDFDLVSIDDPSLNDVEVVIVNTVSDPTPELLQNLERRGDTLYAIL